MMTPDEFLALKKAVTRLQREESRLQGTLDQLLRQLRDEFGCGSAADAKKLLRRLRQQDETENREAERLLRKFDKSRHGKRLKEGDDG